MIVTPAMKRARSDGRRALVAVVASSGQRAIADRLGVSVSVVSHWCSGRARPALRLREEMREAYAIDPALWGRPTEQWTRRPSYRREEMGALTLRHVAAVANVDEGTVRGYLDERATKRASASTRTRVELALMALGMWDLLGTVATETVDQLRKRAHVPARSVERWLRRSAVPSAHRSRLARAVASCLTVDR